MNFHNNLLNHLNLYRALFIQKVEKKDDDIAMCRSSLQAAISQTTSKDDQINSLTSSMQKLQVNLKCEQKAITYRGLHSMLFLFNSCYWHGALRGLP